MSGPDRIPWKGVATKGTHNSTQGKYGSLRGVSGGFEW